MDIHHSMETDHATEVALKTIQRFHQIEQQVGAIEEDETSKRKFTFLTAESDINDRRRVIEVGKETTSGRSLFIFSESNLLRKAAKTLIDWGYPF